MSGGPVRCQSDGVIVGVVSARYNSADGWLRDSVWIARTENLRPLLANLRPVPVHNPVRGQPRDGAGRGGAQAVGAGWESSRSGMLVDPSAPGSARRPGAEYQVPVPPAVRRHAAFVELARARLEGPLLDTRSLWLFFGCLTVLAFVATALVIYRPPR